MKALEGLNDKQKEAVSQINGPMLIIAGAGSGKTRVITRKIAHLVESGIKAENILALTFTDKAAGEMVTRITEILPSIELPKISTFHSFARDVLEENVFSANLNPDFKLLDETSQLVFFSKNIKNWSLRTIDTTHDASGTIQEIKRIISRFKDEMITQQRIQHYIEGFKGAAITQDEQAELDGLNDVRICYEEYEKYKRSKNLIDFGDMLYLVYKMFIEKPSVLSKYQEKYQYVLVDEFQDTNYVQLLIVNMLANTHKNITVVGDDDQSIYKFRGAHTGNIDDFRKLHPDLKEIVLEENYRCKKTILSVANDVIKNKGRGIIKKLVTNNGEGEKARVNEFASDQDQYNFITREILDLSKTNRLKDIAVLVRRRKDAEPLIDTFTKHGIKYEFVGEVSFFEEPLVKDIICYLRFLENPIEENGSLLRILSRDVYWIRKIEIARIGKFAKEKRMSLFEALDHIDGLDVDRNKIKFVKNELVDLMDSREKGSILDLVRKIIYQSGFYSYEISLGNMRNVNLLQHFDKFAANFKRINERSGVKELLEYIDLASGFEMESQVEDANDVVRILTIHAAKGKEFPIVFIPDLVENKLPTRLREEKYKIPRGMLENQPNDLKSDHMNEERRLLYVAITRAMDKLYMSYARRYNDNKRDSKASRFLDEIKYLNNPNIEFKRLNVNPVSIEENSIKGRIKERYIRNIVSDLKLGHFEKAIPKIVLLEKLENEKEDPLKILESSKKIDYDALVDFAKNEREEETVDETHSFSATQFNTYKTCPKKYQYENVYKVSGKTKTYLELGSSVHNTVEDLSKILKEGRSITPEEISKTIQENWIATSYPTKEDEIQSYIEARTMVNNFLDGHKEMKSSIHELEKPFIVEIEGQRIAGKIDRVDKIGNDYIIIDYKTSKMEESEVEAKQNFQLFTYYLACKELYGKYPKQIGLWYLRSNTRVMIEMDEETAEKLKNEVMILIKKIKNSEFSATPGWHCKTCDYANICDSKI